MTYKYISVDGGRKKKCGNFIQLCINSVANINTKKEKKLNNKANKQLREREW